jgi:hypothetical protein
MEADIAAITLCPSFESKCSFEFKFESKTAALRRIATHYASCGTHEFARAQDRARLIAEVPAATA